MSAIATIFLVFVDYMAAFITCFDKFCSAAGAKFAIGPVLALASAYDDAVSCIVVNVSVVAADIWYNGKDAINVSCDIDIWQPKEGE